MKRYYVLARRQGAEKVSAVQVDETSSWERIRFVGRSKTIEFARSELL